MSLPTDYYNNPMICKSPAYPYVGYTLRLIEIGISVSSNS